MTQAEIHQITGYVRQRQLMQAYLFLAFQFEPILLNLVSVSR